MTPKMIRVEKIRAALEATFTPHSLKVEDDSQRHVGHAGAASGHGHYRVEITAAAFAGQPAVARHRMVYAALGALMQTDIHALGVTARAPGE